MALETGTYISDLVATNPTGSDPLAFADDHLRLLKSTIKATFPNISGAVTKTHTQINTAVDQAGTAVQPSAMDAAIAAAVAATKSALYPVGSVYVNATNSTNPATLLGFGTWVAFGAGRVPVGFDGGDSLFNAAEKTGGSKDAIVVSHTHTGTTASSGSHTHNFLYHQATDNSGTGTVAYPSGDANQGNMEYADSYTTTSTAGIAASGVHTHNFTTDASGSSGTNANVQPYITVYMWKRTA